MDAKQARETLKRLCAEWDRAGQLMNRYVRPAGFSLALGVGVAAGAGCSSSGSSDALPPPRDAYGLALLDSAREGPPPAQDAYRVTPDAPIPLDGRVDSPDGAREALPPPQDAYGLANMDVRAAIPDSAREALPPPQDAYGLAAVDVPIRLDAGVDFPDSAKDALPPAPDGVEADGYRPTVDTLASDAGRPDGGDAGANAEDATLAQDGANSGATD
jgi:hypothetical protein